MKILIKKRFVEKNVMSGLKKLEKADIEPSVKEETLTLYLCKIHLQIAPSFQQDYLNQILDMFEMKE